MRRERRVPSSRFFLAQPAAIASLIAPSNSRPWTPSRCRKYPRFCNFFREPS